MATSNINIVGMFNGTSMYHFIQKRPYYGNHTSKYNKTYFNKDISVDFFIHGYDINEDHIVLVSTDRALTVYIKFDDYCNHIYYVKYKHNKPLVSNYSLEMNQYCSDHTIPIIKDNYD